METPIENAEHLQSTQAHNRVMTELKSLSRDAEDLLKSTAGDMSDKVKRVRARLTGALARAKETCDSLQDQTAARRAAKKADTVIREHPYQSIGMGFGLGLLIGVLVALK